MPHSASTLSLSLPRPNIARVALNRPESAGALNAAMGKELAQVFKDLGKKNSKMRVILLSGTGKHFCAGADLKERKGMTKSAWHKQHDAFEQALKTILECPIPVIASVHGAVMGGGLELAMACDFIVSADNARFALPEATLGIMPGLGGTQNLPRTIGPRRAKELLFTGWHVSAQEAWRIGLVNHVFPAHALEGETLTLADAIAKNAPLSTRAIKKSINGGMALSLRAALDHELKHYKSLLDSKDRHEGIAAFNEKRKPLFTGK